MSFKKNWLKYGGIGLMLWGGLQIFNSFTSHDGWFSSLIVGIVFTVIGIYLFLWSKKDEKKMGTDFKKSVLNVISYYMVYFLAYVGAGIIIVSFASGEGPIGVGIVLVIVAGILYIPRYLANKSKSEPKVSDVASSSKLKKEVVKKIIICSNCGHENEADMKFCGECGQKLRKNIGGSK